MFCRKRTPKILYLDHGATSYPHPPCVLHAIEQCMDFHGGNPGRGSHKLAEKAAEEIYSCREVVSNVFHLAPERVVFTKNTTEGINIVLSGLLCSGDHVFLDDMAHNAMYRPLLQLSKTRGVTYTLYPSDAPQEELFSYLDAHRTPETKMLLCTHQSNICSRIADAPLLAQYCRSRALLFVVDAAQSGGHIPIDVDGWRAAAVCLPGHKGLLGPQGTGLLLIGADAPIITPFLYGGSGSHSLDPTMPDDLPEHLEAGTLNTPGIAGLREGILYRNAHPEIAENAARWSTMLGNALREMHDVTVHGPYTHGTVSFTKDNMLPSEIAHRLNAHGICVRSGYHCAPIAHQTLGTMENGTVRVSFGYGNHAADVDRFLDTFHKI